MHNDYHTVTTVTGVTGMSYVRARTLYIYPVVGTYREGEEEGSRFAGGSLWNRGGHPVTRDTLAGRVTAHG